MLSHHHNFERSPVHLKVTEQMLLFFIPPAVELGEPPININKIIIAFDAPVSIERSVVLNPAVLGVTA